jgi:hypothetical protein
MDSAARSSKKNDREFWLKMARGYCKPDSPAMLALILSESSDSNVCDLQNGGAQLSPRAALLMSALIGWGWACGYFL